jgi:hypothetical protein
MGCLLPESAQDTRTGIGVAGREGVLPPHDCHGAVAAELNAQIDKALASGIDVTHISHTEIFHLSILARHLNPKFTQFCPGCFTIKAFGFCLRRCNPTIEWHEAEQSAVGYEPAFQFIAPDTPLRIGIDFDNALSCAAPDAQPTHCSGPVWRIVRVIGNVLANSLHIWPVFWRYPPATFLRN